MRSRSRDPGVLGWRVFFTWRELGLPQSSARVRRENSDLRKLVRIYAEAIRQLTIDKAALEDELQALNGVTVLTARRRHET
ncbi:hypothetical protein [Kitasatospora sp. NPDC056531]|uniref:hypothetical protein n=1 Tax=Kitasatospora sp. NPDC056531 TaxID=3345856 RepID=UPI0036CA63D9